MCFELQIKQNFNQKMDKIKNFHQKISKKIENQRTENERKKLINQIMDDIIIYKSTCVRKYNGLAIKGQKSKISFF
jgi:hypothetical protein